LVLYPLHYLQVPRNRLVQLDQKSVAQPADVAASMLACAFVSRDYDGLPRVLGHKLDIARLYIDGSGLRRICYLHSVVPNTSDSCIRQCASIIASFRHSAVSLDIDCLRVDISQHVVAIADVVVDDVKLAVDLILVGHCSDHLEQVRQREGGRHQLLHQSHRVAVFQTDSVEVLVAVVEPLAVELTR
jgi:hypothetical protein